MVNRFGRCDVIEYNDSTYHNLVFHILNDRFDLAKKTWKAHDRDFLQRRIRK